MAKAFKAMFAAAAALLLCAQSAPERIDYTLTPVMADGALQAVQVDLRFRGDADGETALRVPNAWGGKSELYRAIQQIEAVSGAVLRDGEGPAQRVLTHRPNARIHVRYRIVQDFEGAPNARDGNAYRAIVQPGYFHLIGEAAFLTPEVESGAIPVRVRAQRLPRGWAYASDLEHDGLTLADLWGSVTVGGDFRVTRGRDPNIRIAMRGDDWQFSDESFMRQVEAIIGGQRAFWGDPSTPFLVTVLALEQPQTGWLSIGGTGLGDAFAFFATNNAQEAAITRTLAHESLHTWIPLALGGAPRENEALQYWFSEGFDDFYTGRLLVRQGLWTPQAFAEDLNHMLRAYAISSARTLPNAEIPAQFWSNQDVQQLPYQRGRLLATVWDQRLRAKGQSLDQLMHAIRQSASSETGHERFARAARAAEIGFDADYATYVEGGAMVLLAENALAPCGRIVTLQQAPFHRGFDISATSANNDIIAGVDPSMNAYAAGMRDGMELLARDGGEIGNPDLEIVYRVRDGESERTLRYMPRAPGQVTVQRLELTAPLEGETLAQCLRVLGGA